jgi:hypothetical protein
MPFISQQDADALLRQFYPDFEQIVRAAWNDWRTGPLAHQMQHKRVRANFVWNQLVAHAKRQFDGRPNAVVDTIKNWDGVLIENRAFVRMKKGTDKLLSRNYPTQAALAFHDPIQDLFGGIARLELLYILNDLETEIARIVLVQRYKSNVAWCIDLLDSNGDAQNVFDLPAPEPDRGSGSVADRLIKPKEDRTDHEQHRSTDGT